MKKTILALTLLGAFAAAPAFAGGTHISVGFYSPAPVYYQPAPVYYAPPVVYYPPVRNVYYAPPRPCPPRHYEAYNHRHSHGWNAPRGYAYGYDYRY